MLRRTLLPLSATLALLAFGGAAASAVTGNAGAVVHVHVSPGVVTQGLDVTVHASGFRAHERLDVTVASGHSNFHEVFTLRSETAGAQGTVVFSHRTGARESPDGEQEICVRGVRSHRIGCAGYYVQVPMLEPYKG